MPIKTNTGPGDLSLYFRNLGLFSDTYLLNHLPDSQNNPSFIVENWETDDGPEFDKAYEWMLKNWEDLKEHLPNMNEAELEEKWVRPILKLLGWEYQVQVRLKRRGRTQIPDYSLFGSLDSYRKAQGCKTDEKYFSHVLAVADAKAMGTSLDGSSRNNSNPSYQIVRYMEDTEQTWGILTDGRYWRLYSTRSKARLNTFYEVNIEKFLGSRDNARFKYFYNFFRKSSFVKTGPSNQSFLDVIFEGGEVYARDVERHLKERVFRLVELVCRGFAGAKNDLSEMDRQRIYEHSLYYVFRLMFVLNCEARNLLNVHRQTDYYIYSLRSLCVRLKEEFEGNHTWIEQARSYNYILDLFNLIKNGSSEIGVHGFGSEIFESGDSSFYQKNRIPDSILNYVLVELACSYDEEGTLKFIDYKKISVDHIGSLFEGLLEYKLEAAPYQCVRISRDIVKWSDVAPDQKGALKHAVINKGRPYLESSSNERRETGSYYTPEHIVNLIIEKTLSPLIKDLSAEGCLQLNIVDPAMGSGTFLLGVIRYLEQAILEKLYDKEDNSNLDPQALKQNILEKVIYGTDINPLAVELAKFSLWIYTAQSGQKLQGLNSRLRTGNSLCSARELFGSNETVPEKFKHERTFFDWKLAFPEVFRNKGFDAVIGNPPYVRSIMLSPELHELLSGRYMISEDTYTMFLQRALQLLRPTGRLGFIIPSLFLKGIRYAPLRKHLSEICTIEAIRDCGDGVFAGVGMPTAVIVFSNRAPALSHKLQYETKRGTRWIVGQVSQGDFINNEYKWLPPSPMGGISAKMERYGVPLSELATVRRGLEVGRNTEGLSKEERAGFSKILFGENIQRFMTTGAWFISPSSLKKFGKPDNIFNTRRVLIRETGENLVVAVGESGTLTNRSIYNITVRGHSPYYVAGVLSSAVANAYFHYKIRSETKVFPKIRIKNVNEFPIPEATLENPRLKDLHDRITETVKQLVAAQTRAEKAPRHFKDRISRIIVDLNTKLNQLVGDLYNLTNSEKKAIAQTIDGADESTKIAVEKEN